MYSSDILVRKSDGKRFEVKFHSHWSDIVAADGEEDRVKWAGDEDYVSFNLGHMYTIDMSVREERWQADLKKKKQEAAKK